MTSIPVQRLGSYLEVDEQGHIQSRADAAHIKGEWQLAVEALVTAYLEVISKTGASARRV